MASRLVKAEVIMAFTLEELINQLGSTNTLIVDHARRTLLSMGTEAVEALITAMLPAKGRVSWRAVQILAQIPDSRWIEPMRSILPYAHPVVGQAAVFALKNHDPYALVTLSRALPFSSHMVQLSIVTSLESMGSKYAIPILMEALMTTNSPAMRYTTIQALGNLNATEAVDLIASFAYDPDVHVQNRVRSALRKLNSSIYDDSTYISY